MKKLLSAAILLIISYSLSAHSLIYRAPDLSWQDVLAIDSVWIDLKVDYQFFIDFRRCWCSSPTSKLR